MSCAALSRPVLSIIIFGIDDLTIFYLQQTQGIDLSIHLNELLYYSMAHCKTCVTWREF